MNQDNLNELQIQLPNIPDQVPPLSDLPALIDRYRLLFRGYDTFEPEQFVIQHELDLEWVLQDLITCIKCAGDCRTLCGYQHFFKIDWRGMQLCGNRAMLFRVGVCPGILERKTQIQDLLAGKGIIQYQAPEKIVAQVGALKKKSRKRQKRSSENVQERRKRANEWLD